MDSLRSSRKREQNRQSAKRRRERLGTIRKGYDSNDEDTIISATISRQKKSSVEKSIDDVYLVGTDSYTSLDDDEIVYGSDTLTDADYIPHSDSDPDFDTDE
jgi:hypothetical protein